MKNGAVFENNHAGVIAGNAEWSNFINCVVEDVDFYANIEDYVDSCVGGIVGHALDCSFINCSVDIDVVYEEFTDMTGEFCIGGLAGNLNCGYALRVSNCVLTINLITNFSVTDEDFLVSPLLWDGYIDFDYFALFDFKDFYYSCSLNGERFEVSCVDPYGDYFDLVSAYSYEFFLDSDLPSGYSSSSIDLLWQLNANALKFSDGVPFISRVNAGSLPIIGDFLMVDIVDASNLEVLDTLESEWLAVYLIGKFKEGTSDIYYTIDASSPITNGTLYVGSPLNMTHGITLSVVEHYNGVYGGIKTITFRKPIYLEYMQGNSISGDIPVDATPYKYGDTIPLAWAENLCGPNESDFFIGWSTTPEGAVANMTIIADYVSSSDTIHLYPVFKSKDGIDTWDGSIDTTWYYMDTSKAVYHIYTAAELAGVGYISASNRGVFENSKIELHSDLDLQNIPWEPIDYFWGFFEGNNHIIYNLHTTRDDYAGLFGYFSGTLQNLGLVGGYISSLDDSAGGVIAAVYDSTIRNVWTEGIVVSSSSYVAGGIAGTSCNSTIVNCFSSSTLNALPETYAIGGIVGKTRFSDIKNCVFYGQINSTSFSYAGEITGIFQEAKGPVENVFYNNKNLGGIGFLYSWLDYPYQNVNVYSFSFEDGKQVFSYFKHSEEPVLESKSLVDELNAGALVYSKTWLNSIWEENESNLCILSGETDSSLQVSSWLDEGNFDTSWYYDNPLNNVFHIYTEKDLAGLAYIVNSYEDFFDKKTIYLENDLDLSLLTWVPIGYGNTYPAFMGTFDGKGHTISNLWIPDYIDYSYASLFGETYHAYILNLGIVNCDLSSNELAGALGSLMNYTTIENCFSTGRIAAAYSLGGLVGYFDSDSEMYNCWTSCELVSPANYSNRGYLVGVSENYYPAYNCYWLERENYYDVYNDFSIDEGCSAFYIKDGEYFLENPIIFFGLEFDSLLSILNEYVRYNWRGIHLARYAMRDGLPTFSGYYTSYDLSFKGVGVNSWNKELGEDVLLQGDDVYLEFFLSAGYTLNGASISVWIDGILADTSSYFYDPYSYNLFIPAFAITGDVYVEVFGLKDYFSLYDTPSSNGSLSLPNLAQYGSIVGFLPIPNEGYIVSSVEYAEGAYGEEVEVLYNPITKQYEFFMPADNAYITVFYEPISYSISLYETSGVTTGGTYGIEFDQKEGVIGDLVSITTLPSDFYIVDSVSYTIDGRIVTVNKTAGEYSFEMPAGNIIVQVTFVKPLVAIDKITYDGGFIQISNSSVIAGTEITITPIPNKGYTLSNVYYIDSDHENQIIPLSEDGYTLAVPAYPSLTLFATFEKISFTIQTSFREILNASVTIKDESSSPITTSGVGNEIIVETSIDHPGVLQRLYYIDATGDYFPISLSTNIFEMPPSNITIYAEFHESQVNILIDPAATNALTFAYSDSDCTIPIISSVGNSVIIYLKTIYNTGYFYDSETPPFTVSPNDPLVFTLTSSSGNETIFSLETPASGEFSYTLTPYSQPTSSNTLSLYDVDGILGNGNSYTTDNPSYSYGEQVVIIPTLATGYEINSVSYSYGDSTYFAAFNAIDGYYFSMPNANVTIRLTVRLVDYAIQKELVSVGKGGFTVLPLIANIGDTITVTPTPDIGYEVSLIRYYSNLDSSYVAITKTGSTYSFSMPAENIQIEVEFTLVPYDITPNATDNGSFTATIDLSTEATVGNLGDKIHILTDPNPGYQIKTASVVDDQGKSIYFNYWDLSFTMPSSPVYISVVFEAISYTVYTEPTYGVSIRVKTSTLTSNTLLNGVHIGEEIEIIITPDPGYIVTNVFYDDDNLLGNEVSLSNGKYIFEMSNSDAWVYICVEELLYTVTITSSGLGELSVNGESSSISDVAVKEQLSVLATPSSYSQLKSLYYILDGDIININAILGSYVFAMPAGDIEVVAEFERIPYSITYIDHNSNVISTVSYTYDTQITISNYHARLGYTATGWKVLATSGSWTKDSTLASGALLSNQHDSVTLICQYTLNTYNYSFGDSALTPYTILASNLSFPSAESRKGYTFLHYKVSASSGSWAKDSTFNALSLFPLNSYGDVNFITIYQPIEYTISINTNGGTQISSQTYDILSMVVLPGASSKVGYLFNGWKVTSVDGSLDWTIDSLFNASHAFPGSGLTGNITLTAQWTEVIYEFSIYSSPDSQPTSSTQYGITQTPTIPQPSPKLGYQFKGYSVLSADNASWATVGQLDLIEGGTQLLNSYGDVSLLEVWEAEKITITYSTQGKATIHTAGDASVDYLSSISTFPTLTVIPEVGYNTQFLGWFNSAEGGNQISTDTQISSETFSSITSSNYSITLYARYTKNTNRYTIFYVTLDKATLETPGDTTVDYLSYISQLPTLTIIPEAGYSIEFVGWFNSAEGGNQISTDTQISTENFPSIVLAVSIFSIYARYTRTINTYSLSYDTSGAGTLEETSFNLTSDITLRTIPSRAGYTFNEWKVTTATGNWSLDTIYSQGETINKGLYGNATLTAIWTPIRILQSVGNAPIENVTFNPDGTVTIPDPVQEGFVFSGWYLDAACTVPFNALATSVSPDLVLYAKWEPSAIIVPPRDNKLSPGAIAGIVIGSVAFVALTLSLLYFFVLKKKGITLSKIFGKKASKLDNLTHENGAPSSESNSPSSDTDPS